MKELLLKNKEKIRTLVKICLLLLIFVTIFIANFSELYGPDDYSYSWVQGANPPRHISNLADCIANAKYFYNNWTGRIIPHVLVGIFRNINVHIFEVVNSIVFILLLVFLNKVTSKKASFVGIITAFGYLTYAKMFGEKFTWVAGSLNYLWPTAMMVILISIIYKYIYDDLKLNTIQKIALVLFSFITGFMHETTTFVLGMFFVCIYLLNIKKLLKESKKEKCFYILLFLAFCFGAYLTIFAPRKFCKNG